MNLFIDTALTFESEEYYEYDDGNDDEILKYYSKQKTAIMKTINIFENRIDDCSKVEWIPFYNLHIDPLLFAG